MTEEETDETIAARVQAGGVEAFGELIARYDAKLTRYGRKFLSDPDDLKDLVQDVFLRTYENIQSFDTSRRFSPWVYRIAHNEFVNALKKRSHSTFLPFDLDTVFPHLTASERATDAAEERSLRETLERYLSSLDTKYREPLVLYYFEGMSYKDIAEVLHIPVSTVGVRIARGKAYLKQRAKRSDIYDG